MKKKLSTSKANAKRSRAKPLRILRGPVTGRQLVFDDLPPFKPLSPARQRAVDRKEAVRIAEYRERQSIRRAAFWEKRKRHDSMQGRFTLPDDSRVFLERLYDEPCEVRQLDQMASKLVEELLRQVYAQGCSEGYIEGRVQNMERDRLVSKKRNQRKREKHNLDDRDATIAAEYRDLCGMMAVGQAKERLAQKYECDPRTIFNVVKKAGLVRPRSNDRIK